jgi:hypothetical protein
MFLLLTIRVKHYREIGLKVPKPRINARGEYYKQQNRYLDKYNKAVKRAERYGRIHYIEDLGGGWRFLIESGTDKEIRELHEEV